MSILIPEILIVEDEPSQVEILRFNLANAGYEVRIEMDGEDGVRAAIEQPPDLILLDWMLPNLSGVEACRQLRRRKETRQIPIIMLTARSEENDMIRGLNTGADDYITKPYSIKELLARVKAALRRPAISIADQKLTLGKLEVDIARHRVELDGEGIEISPTEFRLLIVLMQSQDRVLSRGQLLDLVWGVTSEMETRTVDVHIGRLRRALKKAGGAGMVRTVRGFGYSIGE
ncbi:Phosphate regulon transcriptional regulatory protein PhoB (SphR) [hydrothermal vent metagenome]|uniref:Phosphate regulon transcriptional regulatory protein PhoB n=1 Tax=hydrothermal vent metagenome TaxID=652676 RepID=A0A3B0STA0_9ZZZZ